ncbi:UNVERIFIED_CONTAM: 16S rRNA processing protein RimM [Acetivibrio alkalicellulosi]
MIQFFEIGKIVNTHGVKGEIKIIPLTDDPNRFSELKCLFIAPSISTEMEKYNVEGVKYQKNFVILKLEEINDIDTAQSFKDKFVIIDRKDAIKLEKESYFICDLININVFDESGNNLGYLKEVLKTGSNDVYIVKNNTGKEILIPALKTVIKGVFLEEKKMVVSLPQGLIDDEV